MLGSGALLLVLLFIALITVSLLWRQILAPWLLVLGVLLFAYLVLSVMLGLKFPYQTHNISIYVVFFIAVLLVLAGGAGSFVRIGRYLARRR